MSELLNDDQIGPVLKKPNCWVFPSILPRAEGLSTRGALRQTSPPRFNANVGGGEVINHEKTFTFERARQRPLGRTPRLWSGLVAVHRFSHGSSDRESHFAATHELINHEKSFTFETRRRRL